MPMPASAVHDAQETDIRTFLPIGRILCPIDFSDGSRAAVDRALAMDRQHPSALVWAAVQAGRHHDILAEHRFLRAAWTATSHDPAVGDALERLLTKLGDAYGLDALARDRLADRAGTIRD